MIRQRSANQESNEAAAVSAAEPESSRAGSPLNRRIYLLALAVFATNTDGFVIAGILPLLAKDLGVGTGAAGQLLTAYMITYAGGAPVLAALSSAVPRDRLIISCLLLFTLCVGMCALAPNFSLLIVCRVLAACCVATSTPTVFSTAAALAPFARRGAALAIVSQGAVIAQLVGVPAGTWIGHHLGWRMTFVLDAFLVAAAAHSLVIARIPPLPAGPRMTLRARLAPLVEPRIIMTLLPIALWPAGANAIYIYSTVLFGPRLGIDNIAPLLFIFGLGGLLGARLGGWLADRYGSTWPIIGCLLVLMIALGTVNTTGSTFGGAAAALFAISLCLWILFPLRQSRLLALAPNHSAVVLALNNSAGYVGIGGAAVLGAGVFTYASPVALPYAAAAVTLAALALFLVGLAVSNDPIGRVDAFPESAKPGDRTSSTGPR